MSLVVDVAVQVGTLALEVAFDVARTVAVVGPNGAGKTTLLRTLAGGHTPSRGHVRVADRLLFDAGMGIDLPPEHRHVGYVPQADGLFGHLDVLDNVRFGLTGRGLDRAAVDDRARDSLETFGAAHLAARSVPTLSGGERKRVALARALATDPALLLLDEPLSALDVSARRGMRELLGAQFAARGIPVVLVTHDPRDVHALVEQVLVLEAGRVVQRARPADIAAGAATPFVSEVFGPVGPPTT